MRAPRMVSAVAISVVHLLAPLCAGADDSPSVRRSRIDSQLLARALTDEVADRLERLPKGTRPSTDDEAIPAPVPEDFLTAAEAELLKSPLAAIVIEGNQQFPTADVLKLMTSQPGKSADPGQIRKDIYALLKSPRICSAEGRVVPGKEGSGPVLVIRVIEVPILERITYVGNQSIKDDALTKATKLKVGGHNRVEENRLSVERIAGLYRAKGYARVKVKLVKGGFSDEREVVVQIVEGPRVIVAEIAFEGNTAFDEAFLRRLLETQLLDVWRSTVPETDLDRLKQHYHDLGWFDVQITHLEGLSEDLSNTRLVFMIEEGPRYKIRHIEFVGNEVLSEAKLGEGLSLRPNDSYDQRRIGIDVEKIRAQYAELGRVFARAEPMPTTIEEPGYVNLVYRINEDEQFKFGGPAPPNADLPSQFAEDSQLRDIDRIAFAGVKTFRIEQIRETLHEDYDLARAAHPHGKLSNFRDTLQTQLEAGFRHAGFPDAVVAAAVNEVQGRIEVNVTEGQRCRCGDISIVGAGKLSTETLVRALTEDPKPLRILWKIGKPARFDELTVTRIRERLEEQSAEAGFLGSKFDVRIGRETNQDLARLVVTIRDEGLPAVVGRIDVTGIQRDAVADVLKSIDLQTGMPYDSNLPVRLKRRLRDSARFLTSDVTAQAEERPALEGRQSVQNLQIKLREYVQAPAFTSDFSPAEQALLKLREWLERWSNGEIEDDLVMTASSHGNLPNAGKSKVTIRMVVAPNRGQTIVVNAPGADGKPVLDLAFAAYHDRLVLAAPQRKAKLVLPNSAEDRLFLIAKGDSVSGAALDRGGRPFQINFGMGFSREKTAIPSAFEVAAKFSPACIIAIAHGDDVRCEVRGTVCVIRNDSTELQIDTTTGRLETLQFRDKTAGWSGTVRAEKDAFSSELRQLEGPLAASAIAYDQTSPWKSRLEFLVDAWLDLAVGNGSAEDVESLRALRKLVTLWSPPAVADIADIWNKAPRSPEESFWIPSHEADDWGERGSLARKNLVGMLALPLYRRLVPRTGWLWPTGRDALLSWAGDDSSTKRLDEDIESSDTGPIGEWLLVTIGPWLNLDLRDTAGLAGIKRLSVEAFRRDYRPFLAEDSWLGRWFVSLARALNTLDEMELRALGRLLPDDARFDTVRACVQLLKSESSKPLGEALSLSLDRFWSDDFRPEVSAKLRWQLIRSVCDRIHSRGDKAVTPASGEAGGGTEVQNALEDSETTSSPRR
jgi:outer membrane protein assembly factor BamA